MLRALILAVLLALPGAAFARCETYVPGARPQNTAREFVGTTLDDIVDQGWIEFAVYEDFPPYSYDDGGTPRGVDIEVGRIIAEGLGVEARFRLVQAGENLEADLLNYVWKGAAVDGHVSSVMLRVPYNSDFTCRVEQVVFTGQYAGERIGIAYATAAYPEAIPGPTAAGRHEGAPVPAFFRYDTVGIENDSIADFYLTSTLGAQAAAQIRRFPQIADAMAALQAGQVMAVMGPLAQLQAGAGDGIAVHTPPMPGFATGRWTLGLAIHTSHRDLAYAVDDAIVAGLADGRIAAAYAMYGLDFTPPER
ncbi:MAG: transporter substrate-binding domain-containing protein [Pseudomonadota bacterium]